ncbi:hypothetical protein NL676_021152 [Syzygium grande]|nr:hypothetical protein NL676_021152 [Syzygium grande]
MNELWGLATLGARPAGALVAAFRDLLEWLTLVGRIATKQETTVNDRVFLTQCTAAERVIQVIHNGAVRMSNVSSLMLTADRRCRRDCAAA